MAELRRELDGAHEIASKASATWDKFRKERNFHRMHHKRVAQEKNKLVLDIKRLKVRAVVGWGRGGGKRALWAEVNPLGWAPVRK